MPWDTNERRKPSDPAPNVAIHLKLSQLQQFLSSRGRQASFPHGCAAWCGFSLADVGLWDPSNDSRSASLDVGQLARSVAIHQAQYSKHEDV